MDVCFGRDDDGEDVVFRPDLVFVGNSTSAQIEKRIVGVPDMVLEVVSPDYRQHDTQTKRVAYERFGVSEYWLIDPEHNSLTFLRLLDGKYRKSPFRPRPIEVKLSRAFAFQSARFARKFPQLASRLTPSPPARIIAESKEAGRLPISSGLGGDGPRFRRSDSATRTPPAPLAGSAAARSARYVAFRRMDEGHFSAADHSGSRRSGPRLRV